MMAEPASKSKHPRRHKRKLLAVLLTALLPGLGHLYLRMPVKGLALIYIILIDTAALIYLSSDHMQVNVPLLLILVLLIPVVYFYSMFDALQSTDRLNAKRAERAGRSVGRGHKEEVRTILVSALMLIVGGAILFILRQKPDFLAVWLQLYAAYAVAGIFLITGLVLPLIELRRTFKRTGRFTSAVFLLSIGVILVLDQSLNEDYMLLYLKWWPLLLVMLGLETLVRLMTKWRPAASPAIGRRFRLDFKGVVLALLSGFCVFAVTQQDHYLQLWKKVSLNLAAVSADYSEAEGYNIQKPALYIPVNSKQYKLTVDGINGDIVVSKGTGFNLEVQARIYVDQVDRVAAAKIAGETSVEVKGEDNLVLSVKDVSYGNTGKRHPRVNMYIQLPYNHTFELNVTTTNGNLTAKNVASKKITLQSGNGRLEFKNTFGGISAKTLNGGILLSSVNGEINAETLGGSISAENTDGTVSLTTLVGDITVANARGDMQVNTKNGNINVTEVDHKMTAETSNGLISVSSKRVGGDWDIYSAVGDLDIQLPESGSYTLEGSSGYGRIETNLPFPMENKTIQGTKGTGEFKIKLDGNSDVAINETAVSGMNSYEMTE